MENNSTDQYLLEIPYQIDYLLLKKYIAQKTIRKKMESKGIRGKEPNLKGVSDSLDEFYFLNKLKIYCSYLSFSIISNAENLGYQFSNLHLLETVSQLAERFHFGNQLIIIYTFIRKLYESIEEDKIQENVQFMHKIQALIEDEEAQLSPQERLDVYSFLTNFCIFRINKGQSLFRKPFFIYNNAIININYRELHRSEPLQVSIFKNMVMIALSLENEQATFLKLNTFGVPFQLNQKPCHFAWTYQFIEHYGQKEGTEQLYYLYCKAYLEFKKQDFEKAFETFGYHIMWSRNVFLNLDSRMLYCMVIFELEQNNKDFLKDKKVDIFNWLDSYRKQINYDKKNRQMLSDYHIQIHRTFLKLYKRLRKIEQQRQMMNYSKAGLLRAKQSYIQTVNKIPYPYKSWFLDKINEIG